MDGADISNKYQLSLIDPRDGMVFKTELDEHCDNYSGRASQLGGIINSVDRRRRYSLSRSERRHLSQAKLIAHSTWRNFLSPEFGSKSLSRCTLFLPRDAMHPRY